MRQRFRRIFINKVSFVKKKRVDFRDGDNVNCKASKYGDLEKNRINKSLKPFFLPPQASPAMTEAFPGLEAPPPYPSAFALPPYETVTSLDTWADSYCLPPYQFRTAQRFHPYLRIFPNRRARQVCPCVPTFFSAFLIFLTLRKSLLNNFSDLFRHA